MEVAVLFLMEFGWDIKESAAVKMLDTDALS